MYLIQVVCVCVCVYFFLSFLLLFRLLTDNQFEKRIDGDRNCLFRSFLDQLYLDGGERHRHLWQQAMSYLDSHRDECEQFLSFDDRCNDDAENWDAYMCKMQQDGEFGDHIQLWALARVFE